MIVTEADRDAAAFFWIAYCGGNELAWRSLSEAAQQETIRAFAHHRIEATRQAEADRAELVEALQDLLTHSCVSESAPEDKLAEDHAAESNARALIRKHGGNHG